ncbi:hypothetical protein, partial [Mycoplasmopsis bovis]|uniref:hypothetical protein n=1 Tax=Mycoplasmopsis bovis TaxID=28903 RepID=UPI003D265C3D
KFKRYEYVTKDGQYKELPKDISSWKSVVFTFVVALNSVFPLKTSTSIFAFSFSKIGLIITGVL